MTAVDSQPSRRTGRFSGARRASVWIVIAAFNEGKRLGDVLASLCRADRSIVVVDDGSSDGTEAVAARYPVWRLSHAVNCGQGAALQTGVEFALEQGAEYVVTFDADGQHDPQDLDGLLQPLVSGEYDICLGSRFLGRSYNLPWQRRLVLNGGIWVTRFFSRIRVTDTHNGLRAFSRTAAERIRITQNRMAHASELLDQIRREGLRYCERPVTVRYSRESLAKGQSSWNAIQILYEFLMGRMLR